jgi:hypothetical protein
MSVSWLVGWLVGLLFCCCCYPNNKERKKERKKVCFRCERSRLSDECFSQWSTNKNKNKNKEENKTKQWVDVKTV